MIPGVSYEQRWWDDIAVGDELPRVEDHVTYRRVIMNPGTTWDYFPGHHDPAYARAQGQPTIYVNSMHLMGFVDRLATDWAGPRSFVARRRIALRRSIYAGDTMVGEGRVVAKRTAPPPNALGAGGAPLRHLVDLEITIHDQHGHLCVPATVTLALPRRPES
jgi:acyl dehydratase